MENITTVTIDETEYVVIDWGNNQFTSMLKTVWDAQQNSEQNGND